jgi:hypothetical protein
MTDVPVPLATTPAERALVAAADLAEIGAAFVAAVEELRPLAERLARLEAEHRAALNQAHIAGCPRRPARELATDCLLAAVQPLRPYVQLVTTESGRLSAQRLTEPCHCFRNDQGVTA